MGSLLFSVIIIVDAIIFLCYIPILDVALYTIEKVGGGPIILGHSVWRLKIKKMRGPGPLSFKSGGFELSSRGGWKEVIKTHLQTLITPNFAESVNLSSLTQWFYSHCVEMQQCRRLFWTSKTPNTPCHTDLSCQYPSTSQLLVPKSLSQRNFG